MQAARLSDGDMPALYRAADKASSEAQQSFIRVSRLRLGALTLAAVFGAGVGELSPPDWLALGAVIAFLVAAFAEIYLLVSQPERAWYEGRAAAESVKTLTWRYAVGGNPFGHDDRDVDGHLLERLGEVLTDLDDVSLAAGPEAGEQITPAMRSLRGRRLSERREAYRTGRIEDQRAWYSRRAMWNEDRARRLQLVAVGLEGVGAAAGVLAVVGVLRVDLLGIGAAAAASIAAWMQTKQHATLSRAYGVASQELAAIRSDWEMERTEDEWAAFVDEAEEAISREHTLWRASRGVAARWDERGDSSPSR